MKLPESCQRKKRYSELLTARRQATKAWVFDGTPLWPYRCRFCMERHLTSQSPDKQLKNGYNTILK
jgi:hypothetical protein